MPDGDTVSFAATKKYSRGPVQTNVPVDGSGAKTTNLRLQSIDATEKTQPLGGRARDALLKHLGFNPSDMGLSDEDFTADGSTIKAKGWIATHAMDSNYRPLAYLFHANPGFSHGDLISAADLLSVIKSSANYRQASNGWAFPAFYENTDESHALAFQHAGAEARKHKKGVWASDVTTTGFVPTKTALGRGGKLVYPKFYRRVQKWKKARPSADAFIKWLKGQSDGKKMVQGAHPSPVRLWTLFEKVSATKVAVPYDVTKLWFSQ
jgi:endonuclease YncB( thermonuclease family)